MLCIPLPRTAAAVLVVVGVLSSDVVPLEPIVDVAVDYY
jgi:hypothetical protein